MKKVLAVAVILVMLITCCCSCGRNLRKTTAGLNIQVDESSGSMSITRLKIKDPSPMGDKDTWTIFVYLCGSDLESRRLFGGGMGSDDINEMCEATASKNVKFVIETGGCQHWHNKDISNDALGRYIIEKGKLKFIEDVEQDSMGKTSTLTGFLQWGIENYPAEKMGLIFWDHGGGSITGVCFDELEDEDSLSLREIDAALLSLLENGQLTDKLEFIGFDACLMGTVEAANIAASYADYMIASEESEPGSGWDYTAIGNYLAEHPDSDGAELGKTVCDSFKKQCESVGDGQIATMSVTDLSKIDGLLENFNAFAKDIYNKSEDKSVLTSMVRKITSADNYGGNNKAEGYTNMVDLGGLISSCDDWSDKSKAAESALDEAVLYKISGSDHKKASGLSTYYPLEIQGSKELNIFESICVSPYYMSFVGRQGYGSVNGGYTDDYDDEALFEGGFWGWLDNYLYDEDTGEYEYDDEEGSGSWDYFDDHEEGAQSQLISFRQKPGINSNGEFCFELDDEGYSNTSDVIALVYQDMGDGTYIELGETYDVNVDWDTGYVSDNFDGYWLSLPDGQNLATYVVEITDDYILYTSPVLLNGEETFLRMRWYMDDDTVEVEGAWDGINEDGASDKGIIKLRKGDVIVPIFYSVDEDGEDLEMYEGDEYAVKGNGSVEVDYDYLYEGDYSYSFCIIDIFGDDYITRDITFNVENGEVSFYED